MSYFDQKENTSLLEDNADYAIPVTPMIVDILAIQWLYNTPANLNAGNTVYGFNSNVGGWMGELFAAITGEQANADVYRGRPITLTIQDSGGVDLIDFRTVTLDQYITLGSYRASSILGTEFNLHIVDGTQIEQARGGSGNDVLVGNGLDNTLWGGEGSDTLEGLGGFDTLLGEQGNDFLDGGGDRDALWGGYGRDTLDGGNGDDSLVGQGGHDELRGGDGNDTLRGDDLEDLFGFIVQGEPGDDILRGGSGHDWMSAGAGADFLDGGSGNDLAVGGPGEDTLVGWDGAGGQDTLRGGAGADVFYFGVPSADEGDASADFVRIEDFTDGEDRLQISTLGTLTAGIDDVRATQTEDGVLIDGVEVPIPGAPGGGQILLAGFSLSNLDASDFRIMDSRITLEPSGATTIQVGTETLLLISGDGGRWIGGRGYDDNLVGGRGSGYARRKCRRGPLDGGEGRDFVTYQFSPSGVQVDLRAGTGRGGDASGDNLWGIENIIGSAYADILIGDDHDNVIEGRAGADFLLGGGGNDWVSCDYSQGTRERVVEDGSWFGWTCRRRHPPGIRGSGGLVLRRHARGRRRKRYPRWRARQRHAHGRGRRRLAVGWPRRRRLRLRPRARH